jgi:hypothetical protein
MQDVNDLIDTHGEYDQAVREIVQIALRFTSREAEGVLQLAHARLTLIGAMDEYFRTTGKGLASGSS